MQLQTLHMAYFGPYRDATVDFASFAETPLFLISGKTGSGKTTIFDALVFALYGTTSGDERSGDEMRANFATPEEKTRVTLRFRHNGHDYEIWREPAQQLAKKRGGGTTATPMKVCLTVYTDGKETDQWTKQRDVTPRINDLLHLDADQFRQIILLPQGQFRQFLDANSDDKSKLLQRLFGTGLYARWQETLKQQAKDAQAQVAQASVQLAALASQFAYAEGAEPAEGATTADQIAAMKQTLASLTAQQTAQEAALKKAQAAYTKANQDYQRGAQLQQAFDQRQAAAAALAKLAAAAPARAEKATHLAQLEWVAAHTADAERLTQQRQALADLTSALTATAKAAKQAQADLAAAQTTAQALADQAADMTALQQRETQLASLRPQLERVAALTKSQAAAAAQLTAAKGVRSSAQAKVDEVTTAQTANAAAIKALQADDQTKTLQTRSEHLAAVRPVYKQWQAASRDLAGAKADQNAGQNALSSAQTAANDAQKAYTRLHDAQLAGQIAQLAAQLSPGAACPVCGSLEHPHPAVATATAAVSDDAVEAADKARQAAQRDLAQAQAAVDQATARTAQLTAQVTQLAAQLAPDGTVEATYQQLVDEVGQLTAKVAQQQAQLTTLTDERTQLETEEQAATAALKQAETAYHQADAAASAAAASLQTAHQALPQDAPALAELTAEQDRLQSQLDAYAAAKQANQTALSQAKEAVASTQATQQAQTAQQRTQQEALTTAQTAFNQAVAEHLAGGDQTNFTALQAQVDQITPLTQDLAAAQTAQTAQTALLKQANDQIGETSAPDLAALSQAREQAEAAQQAAQTEAVTAQQALVQDQTLLTKIEAAYAQNQDAQAQADALAGLADVLNGNNDRKLSLERFVLRAYLQEVLTVANQRLRKLTAERYQFQLHQDPGSYRNASGLEIDVYDDQVGATRSVHTLSGGESFIAALSLALALGEVIQREAGGVSIDALFVDEGFGSLDAASLHTAMEALETIEGQARMIGIISHMAELRATVPDQLQVIPDGTGESHLHAVHADR